MAIQNPTTNYGWALPTVGASIGTWGTLLNTILGDDVTGIDTVVKALETASKTAAHVTSGTFDVARIPDLDAAKVTTGAFADARIPNLATSKITSGTFADARIAQTNVTQHQAALSIGGGQITSAISAGNVPNLDAGKITTGAFDVARIPDLDADKITTGTFATARIPGLGASRIVAGTFSVDRIPTITAAKVGSDVGKVQVSTGDPTGTPANGTIHYKVPA